MVRSWSTFLKTMGLAVFLTIPATQAFAQATFNQYLSAGNKKYAAADYEAGLKYYKAAVKLNGQSAAAHQGMGNCYYGLGQKENALLSYDKALALDPGNEKLAKFIERIRGAQGVNNDLPSLEPVDNNDLSVGMNQAAEEDSKKYNKYTSGRNYTKNMLEIFIGPIIAQGGTIGFGFGSGYYFPATKGLFVGVAQNMAIYSGDSYDPYYGAGTYTQFDFETLLLVKYKFEGQIRPMIFGGGGLDTSMTMFSSSYYDFDYGFFPEVTVGGGVDFQLGNDVSVFAQGRLALLFANGGTATNIPIEIGFSFPVN